MLILRPWESLVHVDDGRVSASRHLSLLDHGYVPFGDLCVFDDNRLMPGAVSPIHPDAGVEEITYVAAGTADDVDGRGGEVILAPGSVRRATLDPGGRPSTANHSSTGPMRLVQMWIIPARQGLAPSAQQRSFSAAARRGRWLPVVVPARGYGGLDAPANPGAVTVHQDLALYATLLDPGHAVLHQFRPGFDGYLFLVAGQAHVSTGQDAGEVDHGGAAKIIDEWEVTLRARGDVVEALLVETRANARGGPN
jgi:redox-sensitive bicupin YhaK (pirin superfamily)